ncbi:hypothetical protein GGS26DRAFT_541715 [Hypomontagnella submonticulosa]|nr:hypothetical protein GGS26DRAFT_541715 [Hypomontagnella submonticulosa]
MGICMLYIQSRTLLIRLIVLYCANAAHLRREATSHTSPSTVISQSSARTQSLKCGSARPARERGLTLILAQQLTKLESEFKSKIIGAM